MGTKVEAKRAMKKLTKRQLNHFKEKLLKEKRRVLEEMNELGQNNLKQTISEQAGEISRYSYHLGDAASLSYDREFSMGLSERQQKYLEQVDEALARIENETYGVCMVTGEFINIERLEEVPVAKYSVKGKEILEKQKQRGSNSP
jgi:DnaK suppressor protein